MDDRITPRVGERAVGLLADQEGWTRTRPGYARPLAIVRGIVITSYSTVPDVASIRDDRSGRIVLTRDVRLERGEVRGASR